LVEDCDAYLNGLRLRLWPPWSNLAGLEPERRKAAESLHYTWTRLHAIERTTLEDPNIDTPGIQHTDFV
jgi:hypothetical protein